MVDTGFALIVVDAKAVRRRVSRSLKNKQRSLMTTTGMTKTACECECVKFDALDLASLDA